MTRYENLFVYCRETEEGPYLPYTPVANATAGQGRFCVRRGEADGTVTPRFDRGRFGYAPIAQSGAGWVGGYDTGTLHPVSFTHLKLPTIHSV